MGIRPRHPEVSGLRTAKGECFRCKKLADQIRKQTPRYKAQQRLYEAARRRTTARKLFSSSHDRDEREMHFAHNKKNRSRNR